MGLLEAKIWIHCRVSMVVNCMMDLTNYPLDDQECFLRILSYAYDIQVRCFRVKSELNRPMDR